MCEKKIVWACVDEKTYYLAPHQETSEMIEQLYKDIVSAACRRPSDVETSSQALHRYVQVRNAMKRVTGLFTWRNIHRECLDAGYDFTETEIKDQINFFVALKRCRIMADLEVGEVVEKVYLYEC